MKSLEPAQSAWPASWLEPDWPVPSHVRAVCTSREGGTSTGPWGSLNLGDHVADEPAAVQANRAVLAQALGAKLVFMQQVHGFDVAELPGAGDVGEAAIVADACVTTAVGVACTVMVADCLPVLLANTAGTVVAAAHAGWRGLAGKAGQGVLESVYQRFSALALDGHAQGAINTVAWMGPCIGPTAFEVGDEVKAAFVQTDPDADALFRASAPGKWWASLPGLARRRLQALGVSQIYGNDGSEMWCTVHNASRFFSYRRDQIALGGSGRFAASVWIDGGSGRCDNLA